MGVPMIRVLRVLEYVYDNADDALDDEAHWFVQGTKVANKKGGAMRISSVVVSRTVVNEVSSDKASS